MMDDKYKTNDLQLASYLLASGWHKYTPVKIGTIVFFYFEENDGDLDGVLDREEERFWQNNVSVSPKALFAAHNELRLRIRNLTQ